MASPQIDKGHFTRIHNEILEHIAKTNLNGTQFRIVMLIWRYTYGYGRKEHEMPLAFISHGIKTTKGHVDRELTHLIERKIINVVGVGHRRGRILSFNKNYDDWKEEHKEPAKPPVQTEKPKPKKREQKVYEEKNTYYKMATYFFGRVQAVAKEAKVEHLIRKANLQKWADDFRKLVEVDEVTDKNLIRDVMDWVTTDDFWKTNVLSAKKFREKFAELAIKMNTVKKPKKQPPQPTDIRDKEIAFQKWISEGGEPNAFDWGK